MSVLRLTAGMAISIAALGAAGCDDGGGEPSVRSDSRSTTSETTERGNAEREGSEPTVPILLSPGSVPVTRDIPVMSPAPNEDAALQFDEPGDETDAGSNATAPLEAPSEPRVAAPDDETHEESEEESPTPAIDDLAREMRELAVMALQTHRKLLNLSVSDPFVDETEMLSAVSKEMRAIARSSIETRKALLELRFGEVGKPAEGANESSASQGGTDAPHESEREATKGDEPGKKASAEEDPPK